jgi:hypothetical protein
MAKDVIKESEKFYEDSLAGLYYAPSLSFKLDRLVWQRVNQILFFLFSLWPLLSIEGYNSIAFGNRVYHLANINPSFFLTEQYWADSDKEG